MNKKYIKVMPEYFTNAVWDETGTPLSLKDLDLLDDSIARKLILWNHAVEDYFVKTEDGQKSPLLDKMKEELYSQGYKIAQYILNEKPDFEIIYQFEIEKVKITEPLSPWKAVDFGSKLKIN